MKEANKRALRLGLPLLVAALYGIQTIIHYSQTGEISSLYVGTMLVFLLGFGILWLLDRR